MSGVVRKNTPKENAFDSIADFQDCMSRNGEVGFLFLGKEYGITPTVDGKVVVYEYYNEESEQRFEPDDTEGLLNCIIEDKKLREIITEVEVFGRTV